MHFQWVYCVWAMYSCGKGQHVMALLVARQKCVICAVRVGLWRIDDLLGWKETWHDL